MSGEEYLRNIVSKYSRSNITSNDLNLTQAYLERSIKNFAGESLNQIKLSGSRAKGTAITLSSDIDLFVSFKSTTTNTLKELYKSLYRELNRVYTAREQNVSIGVQINGYKIDVVPAKKQDYYSNDHSLYLNKKDSWTKTNIDEHINLVKSSGRIEEITLTKIWRERNGLEFPSIYLELSVIEALRYKNKGDIANNFFKVLDYLSNDFINTRIIDPANTNNIISNDIYQYEKEEIKRKAQESKGKQYWENIIW